MNPTHSGKHAKKHNNRPEQTNLVQSSGVVHLIITDNQAGQRIDNFLFKTLKGVPKGHIYRLLRSGQIRVNSRRIDQTYRLIEGDTLRIAPITTAQREEKIVPKGNFEILYEDDFLLAINKPAGVAVHGGSGVSFGVIEQLRATRPQAKFLELVHRLDKETSGVLLLAKKRSALVNMHEQVREGHIDKRYQTLVKGNWHNQREHVKLPLLKYHTADGERRVRVDQAGQQAHTIFNVKTHYPEFTLLDVELKTGRTHQIRVHSAASGHVIAGDDKYGDFTLNKQLQKGQPCGTPLKRMFLHAWRISFVHPQTGKQMTITAPLPEECSQYLESLAKQKTTENEIPQ